MWPKRGRGPIFPESILVLIVFLYALKNDVSSRDSHWKSLHSIIHIFVPKSDIDEARQDTWYAWYISRELIIYLLANELIVIRLYASFNNHKTALYSQQYSLIYFLNILISYFRFALIFQRWEWRKKMNTPRTNLVNVDNKESPVAFKLATVLCRSDKTQYGMNWKLLQK